MKKEYIQRRDYIIEKMTKLGFETQTRWGLYLATFRYYNQDSFAFLEGFTRRRLLALLSLVPPLVSMERAMLGPSYANTWNHQRPRNDLIRAIERHMIQIDHESGLVL